MSASMFIVVAEEDDYYPHIATIGVFATEEEANAFADAQPRYVYPWALEEFKGSTNAYREQMRNMKRAYSYEVVSVPVSPVGDWKPRAE